MKKQTKLGKFIYLGATAALLFTFGLFVMEKTQVINLYNKPADNNKAAPARPVNDVQYTPADPTDNDEINQKKGDGTIDSQNQVASGSPINVVLTAAGQDVVGGPVVIKVLLTDTTSGTCDIALTQNDIKKSYSSSVINAGNYYTCDGFEIPLDELGVGKWDLNATVTSTDRSGSASQTLEVKL